MDKEMTLGNWIATVVLTCIPCINLIMLIVWAVGNGYVERKRYAQATLIVAAVLVVLYIIFMALFGTAIMSSLNALGTTGYFIF